jgi:hypothetical protein
MRHQMTSEGNAHSHLKLARRHVLSKHAAQAGVR